MVIIMYHVLRAKGYLQIVAIIISFVTYTYAYQDPWFTDDFYKYNKLMRLGQYWSDDAKARGRTAWVPYDYVVHIGVYPEVDIIGAKRLAVALGQKNVEFTCKLDYLYREGNAHVYNLRKSMFRSALHPIYTGMKIRKYTVERFDLYKKFKNNDPGYRKSFTTYVKVTFPPIQFKHARKYKCTFHFPEVVYNSQYSWTYSEGHFEIVLHDFVSNQCVSAVGFGTKPLVYQTSKRTTRRPGIFSVGSDVQKYRFTCDCKEGKGEELKFMRAAWKFHHSSGMGGRAASELPRGVVASRINSKKLSLRISSLEEGIEGWYHCEWRSLRAWNHPFLSPEFKLIPYDDDSCKVLGVHKKVTLCHKNAACIDARFTYYCLCNDGFTGDGKKYCDDVDECSRGIDKCDLNAQCMNQFGDYTCKCDEGYKGDGWTCSLSDFNPEEIIQVNYKSEGYNKPDANMSAAFLDDDAVFDWGNDTILTKTSPSARATINSSTTDISTSLGIAASALLGMAIMTASLIVIYCWYRKRESSDNSGCDS